MTEGEIENLRDSVFAVSTRRDSYHHGERHWRAVAWAGLHLVRHVDGCRPLVVLLFSLFHDAMRENEYTDPEHGLRGAELSRRMRSDGRLPIADTDADLLYGACRDHTDVDRSDDPTIGVCWDSDRLNLWRVGKRPDPQSLSTPPAREPALIEAAASFHDGAHDWDELTRRYLELKQAV